jgi:hypothetical protein
VPTDHSSENAVERENVRLKSSLERCHAMLDDYRSKMAANANEDYRSPYETENRPDSLGGDAS